MGPLLGTRNAVTVYKIAMLCDSALCLGRKRLFDTFKSICRAMPGNAAVGAFDGDAARKKVCFQTLLLKTANEAP